MNNTTFILFNQTTETCRCVLEGLDYSLRAKIVVLMLLVFLIIKFILHTIELNRYQRGVYDKERHINNQHYIRIIDYGMYPMLLFLILVIVVLG